MKLCPACQRKYEDDAMSFCLEDGTPLVSASAPSSDPGATIKIPAARLTNQAPTEVFQGAEAESTILAPTKPAQRHVPDAASTPPARKQSSLFWVLGAALILGLSGIIIALIMTRGNDGPENSQIAQTANQSGNTTPAYGSNTNATIQTEAPTVASMPTPASDTGGQTQTSRTPEQNSATVKVTPTPRSTPSAPSVKDEPPAPPTPTPAARPRGPISGGVLNGKAISLPRPSYPAIARAARASGTVTVQVTLDESGKVVSARAVSGHPLLQQSAVQAAYGARFSPTQLSGQPVKVTGVITYNFVAP
jgi:TonB family protein